MRFLFVLLFSGPISKHELLCFPTDNSGEAETTGMGDWPTPGPQPDLGRSSALSAPSLRDHRIAAKGARGTRRACCPRAAEAAGAMRSRRLPRPHHCAAEGCPCDPSGPAEQHGTPRNDWRWPPGGGSDGRGWSPLSWASSPGLGDLGRPALARPGRPRRDRNTRIRLAGSRLTSRELGVVNYLFCFTFLVQSHHMSCSLSP